MHRQMGRPYFGCVVVRIVRPTSIVALLVSNTVLFAMFLGMWFLSAVDKYKFAALVGETFDMHYGMLLNTF
jgi:hypothetical protein